MTGKIKTLAEVLAEPQDNGTSPVQAPLAEVLAGTATVHAPKSGWTAWEKAMWYPALALGRAGLLPRAYPFVPKIGEQTAQTLQGIDQMGTYRPGNRESANVEDRRPTSIWSFPR